MTIVGGRPESGIRIEIERARGDAAPWSYDGRVATPETSLPLRLVLSADGHVQVDLPDGAPAGLNDKIRLLARSLWKHAKSDGVAPPRRLVRWRADA